ncbi:MAG: FAD-binding oxidoreductase [Gammaproteobacteria bacterium]
MAGDNLERLGKAVIRTLPPWVRRRLPMPQQSRRGHSEPGQDATSLADDAFRARATQIHRETPRSVTVEFELLEGYRFNYRAGQYVALTLSIGGVWFQRCFSLSSAPDENRYSVTVQKVFHGRVTSWMNESLRIGDEFYVSEPAGDFVLPLVGPEQQRYVLVASVVPASYRCIPC